MIDYRSMRRILEGQLWQDNRSAPSRFGRPARLSPRLQYAHNAGLLQRLRSDAAPSRQEIGWYELRTLALPGCADSGARGDGLPVPVGRGGGAADGRQPRDRQDATRLAHRPVSTAWR